jgi:hypothetical protein
MLWIGSDEDGNVRSEREEDEGTDCEMETDWLVKVDRIWYALCIKSMKFIAKYFFSAHVLYLDIYIFPLQTCFIRGGVLD